MAAVLKLWQQVMCGCLGESACSETKLKELADGV